MNETSEKLRARYTASLHAMQSGVAFLLGHTGSHEGECSPKHLRVGVNAAMIDCGAVAKLLVEKGVFTEEEYFTALADLTDRDVATYKAKIKDITGLEVNLA